MFFIFATEAQKHRNTLDSRFFDIERFPLQGETNNIIGLGIKIHRKLGAGFLEIVYKDAFQFEFNRNLINYSREKEYPIWYEGVLLPHKFYADFVVYDQIILEVRSKEAGIAEEDYAQTLNYLKVSSCKIGLILNFGKLKLDIKRVIL